MALPFFYDKNIPVDSTAFTLDEDTSKHVVQVLRMKEGDRIRLTDGRGTVVTCSITGSHRKHCGVLVEEIRNVDAPVTKTTIAISLLKNPSRFEWFLEKATELGVSSIVPLLCERTEKESFRYERMLGICISAMLQSQQAWLPDLQEPRPFTGFLNMDGSELKMIAHCGEEIKNEVREVMGRSGSASMLIGPEGDFSPAEILQALDKGLVPVNLGKTRLRSETAGIVAATLMKVST